MGHIQSLDDLISFLLRRKSLIIAITILGIALSVFVAKSRPKTYETAAAIQITLPQVAEGQTTGAAPELGSAQLLQSIEQRLTTRENLLAMIERHGLFSDAPGLTPDQKVSALRAAVTFLPVASAANQSFGQPAQVSALLIYARLGDPELAARVANDFAQSVLDLGAQGQADRALATFTFFADEERRVSTEVAAMEAAIADYKNTHADALPEMEASRRDELVSIENDLRDLNQTLAVLSVERDGLLAKETRRATDQRRLDELTTALTLNDAQRTSLADRRAILNTAVAQTPEVERELRGLDRQLQQLQDQYTVVSRRLAEAETDQRLADNQQDQRFALLERAVTPEFASNGGGRKIAALGAMASLALALVAAFFADMLRPVIRTEAQMLRELDLRPVVSIPEVPLRLTGDEVGPPTTALGLPKVALIASLVLVGIVGLAVSLT
jgi:tyrosine-protein kinase Etk/Wzc